MEYQRKYQKKKTVFALSISFALIVIVLVLSFIFGSSMVSTPQNPTAPPDSTLSPVEGELTIYDETLITAIKKQLSIEGEITKEHMERLEVLDYDEGVIEDLRGLQFAVNLKELRIKVNVLTLEPILNLHINKLQLISDVSVQPLLHEINRMSYLSYLDLSDCGISSVGYLSELPVLETLILDNNRISGLNYLNQMRTLSTLSLKNCGIKNISAFTDNKTIRNFYIDNNLIEDISVLDTMLLLQDCTYEGNPSDNKT